MKQFEELEQKVLRVIEKNKELKIENELLKKENQSLVSKCSKMEEALMAKDKTSEDLEREKAVIKDSIRNLLDSISSLEEKNKEIVK